MAQHGDAEIDRLEQLSKSQLCAESGWLLRRKTCVFFFFGKGWGLGEGAGGFVGLSFVVVFFWYFVCLFNCL